MLVSPLSWNTQSLGGGGKTSLLFGISASDGNYAIFDSELKTINNESVFGNGNIDTHPTVKLTNQDLNGYSNASECVGKGYYALDGNTVANKPSNTNGFVMQVYKSGDNSLLQMVYSFSASSINFIISFQSYESFVVSTVMRLSYNFISSSNQ